MDRSWVRDMSERLLLCAVELRVDGKEVPWEELISSDSLLTEVGAALERHRWPSRSPQEIRQELLRMQGKWEKLKFRNESSRAIFANEPYLWIGESEDDDDVFEPTERSKRAAAAKAKKDAAAKAKSGASTKGKSGESSKGKGGASTEAGGCIDGR